jgi:diaminopimelate epimerase
MQLEFSKMHGLGNDFIVIDAINQDFTLTPKQITKLCRRNFGIGCDQLLLVQSSERADFRYRIFNADGSEVAQCGNGARCLGKFVSYKGLTNKKELTIETLSGIMQLELLANGEVQVDMGSPRLSPTEVPFMLDRHEVAADSYYIDVEQVNYQIGVVSLGNPHAVMVVTDVATAPVATVGAKIESHLRFPQRTNVGFMQILDRHNINLRVFERGVGETLACGSGACAAVVIGQLWQLLDPKVKVNLPGGSLDINWSGKPQDSVFMLGEAVLVFDGQIRITEDD